MIDFFKNQKNEFEDILRSLARQDFDSVVDGLDILIKNLDYILRKKEIEIIEVRYINEIIARFGNTGLPKDIEEACRLVKVYDIETFKQTGIKVYFDGLTCYYDENEKKWSCEYDC